MGRSISIGDKAIGVEVMGIHDAHDGPIFGNSRIEQIGMLYGTIFIML